jgi:ABC-type uncharacterized transport system permease subunit
MREFKYILLVLSIFYLLVGSFDWESYLEPPVDNTPTLEIAEEDIVSFGDEEVTGEEESVDSSESETVAEVKASDQVLDSEVEEGEAAAQIVIEGVGEFSVSIDSYFWVMALFTFLGAVVLFGWEYQKRGDWPQWVLVLLGSLVAITLIIGLLALAAKGSQIAVGGMIGQSLRLATPVILGAMVGLLCERSGIINIGIEGTMLMGACFGFLGAFYSGSPYIGVVVAIVCGVLVSALHAMLSITFRCDQIISGTFVNILAVGVTGFLRAKYIIGGATVITILPTIELPLLHQIPFIGPVLFVNKPIVLFMLFLVPFLYFIMNYTSYGLKTRALGEHPKAADTVGIFVNRLRYINVLLAGAIAGVGGAWFSVETTGSFDDLMTSGKGFIALAAMIFGRYNPPLIFAGALLFGFADALQIKLQITRPNIPYQFLSMVPYLITMVVLAGVIGRAHPPKAVGKPYVK